MLAMMIALSYIDDAREKERTEWKIEKMSCKMWLKILAASKNIRKEIKIYSRLRTLKEIRFAK